MNIAFITPQMIVGGAEQYIATKCDWLNRLGHQTIVISSGGCNIDCLPNKTHHYLIKELIKPTYGLSNKELTDVSSKLCDILKSEKIDIIESHNTWPAIYVALAYKKCKVPFVLNILNEMSYDRNPILQYLTKRLDKFGLYFTLTTNMNSYIQQKCHKKLYPTILPIPVSRENLTVSDGKYVLSVCRMSPEKMYIKFAIEGFYEGIKNKKIDPKYRFIVVGDGPLFSDIKTLAEKVNTELKKEAVVMYGTIVGRRLHELYADCTCYIGMGTTLLSAASYSKPSIIPGFQDSTIQYAWGFWGVNQDDYKKIVHHADFQSVVKSSYADIISDILSDGCRRHEIGSKAKELFDSHYEINIIMKKWIREYSKIIAANVKQNYKYLYMLDRLFHLMYKPYALIKKIKR